MTQEVPKAIKESLVISLDVDDLIMARRLCIALEPYFGVAKVGMELFAAVGPDIISFLEKQGFKVFLDVKLHDNPKTVERAARVMGSLGVSYLTLHAFGGVPMLKAGVEGLVEGADNAGLEAPRALAVTILTGDSIAPPYVLGNRVASAVESGCHGVVCSASDVQEAKQLGPRLVTAVTGVSMSGEPEGEFEDSCTAQEAMASGADLMVFGAEITHADDPAAVASQVISQLG